MVKNVADMFFQNRMLQQEQVALSQRTFSKDIYLLKWIKKLLDIMSSLRALWMYNELGSSEKVILALSGEKL